MHSEKRLRARQRPLPQAMAVGAHAREGALLLSFRRRRRVVNFLRIAPAVYEFRRCGRPIDFFSGTEDFPGLNLVGGDLRRLMMVVLSRRIAARSLRHVSATVGVFALVHFSCKSHLRDSD